jgi:hypothetical protein
MCLDAHGNGPTCAHTPRIPACPLARGGVVRASGGARELGVTDIRVGMNGA